MEAKDLLAYSIDNIGFQLEKTFEGISASSQEAKACESGMCPKEMVEHICEAYQAVITTSKGGTHEWGTFAIVDKSWENLNGTFKMLREQAKDAVLNGDDEMLKAGIDYIVLHDAYHVGQMASIRLETDPGWDPYSIYQH